MKVGLIIPPGYELVETDQVVATDEAYAYIHLLKFFADRHTKKLNEGRLSDVALYRYETERTPENMRKQLGFMNRWACVPKQNVLRKKESR